MDNAWSETDNGLLDEIYPYGYIHVCQQTSKRARAIIICSKKELSDECIKDIGDTWASSIKHVQYSTHESILVLVDKTGYTKVHHLVAEEEQLGAPA